MTLTRPRIHGLILAALIFVIDQAVKWLVTGPLGIRAIGDQLELLPFFDLTFAANTGISLNLFAAETELGRWLLVAVTAAVALTVGVWMLREKARGEIMGLAMVLGGALGNIVDRVRLGYVIDYADLHFGEFRPFLIFNVADAAITIGILIILARSFLIREKGASKSETAPET
jgi:signal peptidase II